MATYGVVRAGGETRPMTMPVSMPRFLRPGACRVCRGGESGWTPSRSRDPASSLPARSSPTRRRVASLRLVEPWKFPSRSPRNRAAPLRSRSEPRRSAARPTALAFRFSVEPRRRSELARRMVQWW